MAKISGAPSTTYEVVSVSPGLCLKLMFVNFNPNIHLLENWISEEKMSNCKKGF